MANTKTPSQPYIASHLTAIAWLLTAVTVTLAIVIWQQSLDWNTAYLSAYTFFPVLGLSAFSIMWSQYITGFIRRLVGGSKDSLHTFSAVSGSIVTMVVILHPLTLAVRAWKDTDLLPPGSYFGYVATNLQWAVVLGIFSLGAFVLFELRHKYSDRSWWQYVDFINDVAIVAIFIHAYKLGTHTQYSWFQYVWIFYGATLGLALAYKYIMLHKKS